MLHGDDQITKKKSNELRKLKRFFDNNLDFYNYNRTRNSFLDFNFFYLRTLWDTTKKVLNF